MRGGKEREGVRWGRQCAETIKVPEEMLAIHLCFAAGVGASVLVPLIADISTKLAVIAPISTKIAIIAPISTKIALIGASCEVLGTLSVPLLAPYLPG